MLPGQLLDMLMSTRIGFLKEGQCSPPQHLNGWIHSSILSRGKPETFNYISFKLPKNYHCLECPLAKCSWHRVAQGIPPSPQKPNNKQTKTTLLLTITKYENIWKVDDLGKCRHQQRCKPRDHSYQRQLLLFSFLPFSWHGGQRWDLPKQHCCLGQWLFSSMLCCVNECQPCARWCRKQSLVRHPAQWDQHLSSLWTRSQMQ